jgi:hypothetical protein
LPDRSREQVVAEAMGAQGHSPAHSHGTGVAGLKGSLANLGSANGLNGHNGYRTNGGYYAGANGTKAEDPAGFMKAAEGSAPGYGAAVEISPGSLFAYSSGSDAPSLFSHKRRCGG